VTLKRPIQAKQRSALQCCEAAMVAVQDVLRLKAFRCLRCVRGIRIETNVY
jgi:hypothetical protein